LDVTDYGQHLTSQVNAFNLQVTDAGVFSLIFLTNFVGGMWLRILNEPNLLWARFGGVLLFSLNALLSYKILSVYFDRKRVFFTVFAATLLITQRILTVLVDYYNFPALLQTIELLILNQLLHTPSERNAFKVYSFLLGFMAIPIILARIPLILIVLVPGLVFLYYAIAKKDMTDLKASAPYVILGTMISLTFFVLFYKAISFLGIYIDSVKSLIFASVTENTDIIDEHYTVTALAKRYIRKYMRAFKLTVLASICLYIVSLLKDRLGNKITIALGLVLVAWAFGFHFAALRLIRTLIGLTLLVSFIFFMHDRGKNRNVSLLLIVSNFIMIINHIGSDYEIKP
jgi:hypothetical protein